MFTRILFFQFLSFRALITNVPASADFRAFLAAMLDRPSPTGPHTDSSPAIVSMALVLRRFCAGSSPLSEDHTSRISREGDRSRLPLTLVVVLTSLTPTSTCSLLTRFSTTPAISSGTVPTNSWSPRLRRLSRCGWHSTGEMVVSLSSFV